MKSRWVAGNRATLLENGEEYFPAVFSAIRAARFEVILETFIVFEDKVGLELQAALLQAAQRGVQIDVMVDGFGSAPVTEGYIETLTAAGVRFRSFDPSSNPLSRHLKMLRRMHRKIVVIDRERAFVGGINYSADHLMDFGPLAKQDYAVELEGPIVDVIHRFVQSIVQEQAAHEHRPQRLEPAPPQQQRGVCGDVGALLVVRDNHEHSNDIERHYRAAIRAARKRVLIANAYFFPGHRLLREIRRAARRGVDVQLILQGKPDMPIAKFAATWLYEYLQRDGVKIHEYLERPLHGKVAVVDDDWSTIGSSNLDPLSLALNLEANVVLRSATFAADLRGRLERLIAAGCIEVAPKPGRGLGLWPQFRSLVVFHFLRNFASWASWLPPHAPRVKSYPPPQTDDRRPADDERLRGTRPATEHPYGR
ncbi:MAG TPA: cardiolipin synthase ClsB [Burkholderiaceae bacterium]